MKRILCLLLASLMCFVLIACGNSEEHIGEAKTPSASSIMKGRDYESVVEDFEEKGFKNIRLEKIEDLITGWLTKDGEVERVTVGGDEDYSADKWMSADIEVVIYYHTFADDSTPENETLDENNSTAVSEDSNIENDENQENSSGEIEMPYSSTEYCGEEWTLERLTEHLTDLGFTNLTTVACDPDDDNYNKNIFEIYIETGWVSTDPWEAGEKFDSDAEISVYYNEFPLLTVENCPDLVAILTSDEISYMTFANNYDGRYVEFDGYVYSHLTYNAGIDHIIDVAGGDYTGEGAPGHIVRVGDRTWNNAINESVEEGDHVTISGRIDASWCEYFKQLYVETLTLSRR